MQRAHVYVSGRVQGVSYRQSAKAEAERLGLAGWVRNLGDGRVEGVVEGAAAAVEAWLAWARKGPPAARVDELHIFEELPATEAGFRILQTQA